MGNSPYCKVGILTSEINLDVYDSESVKRQNRWYGGFDGFVLGAGINYVLGGDSVVMEQYLLDIGLTYYYSGLNTYDHYSGSSEPINSSISIWELHGSLIINKAFKLLGDLWLTPYAGANMLTDYGRWNYSGAGISLNGSSSSIHVITGIEISLKSISAKFELSLFEGFGIAAGLNFDFGY